MINKSTAEDISLLNNIDKIVSQNIPKIHWCGHYFEPGTQKIIPDGALCCWSHMISLPQRWGVRHPMYSWEEEAIKLFNEKNYFYVEKPPKIGATFLYLSLALHQAVVNPEWNNGQVALVVGTGLNESEKMINRCKKMLMVRDKKGRPIRVKDSLLYKVPINEDYNNKKEFTINGCEFRAFPANNIDAIRSQPNMKMILVDEIAFFNQVLQSTIRDAVEHYIGGSDTKIVLVTTAGNSPSGVAYEISQEEPSIYHKILLDYPVGLEVHPESKTSLYRPEDIEKAKLLPSFPRNFLRQWSYGSGDLYDSKTVDLICKTNYELKDVRSYPNALACDPAYGLQRSKTSSKFAVLGGWLENGILYIRSWEELTEPTDEAGLTCIRRHLKLYGYRSLVCDGHWSGIIRQFQNEGGVSTEGIDFNQLGLTMTDNASKEVADLKVRIHPTCTELPKQMRGAVRGDNGQVNKKITRYDLGDCLNLLIQKLVKGRLTIIKV